MATKFIFGFLSALFIAFLGISAIWAFHLNVFFWFSGSVKEENPFLLSDAFIVANVFAKNIIPLLIPMIILSPIRSISIKFLFLLSGAIWLIFFISSIGGSYLASIYREIASPYAGVIVWERVFVSMYELSWYLIDAGFIFILFYIYINTLRKIEKAENS